MSEHVVCATVSTRASDILHLRKKLYHVIGHAHNHFIAMRPMTAYSLRCEGLTTICQGVINRSNAKCNAHRLWIMCCGRS
jgi:hypothetical protein